MNGLRRERKLDAFVFKQAMDGQNKKEEYICFAQQLGNYIVHTVRSALSETGKSTEEQIVVAVIVDITGVRYANSESVTGSFAAEDI